MIYPFTYHVQYWCESVKMTAQGITFGQTLADATKYISDFYGEQDIDRLLIVAVEDAQGVMELEPDVVDEIEKRAERFYG